MESSDRSPHQVRLAMAPGRMPPVGQADPVGTGRAPHTVRRPPPRKQAIAPDRAGN